MKLHPQNQTPGENTTPDIKPVTIGELVDVVAILVCEIRSRSGRSYYLDAAVDRLEDIKKRL